MIDSASIISGLATATAIVALIVVLEKRTVAAIRAAKTIAAEFGFKKNLTGLSQPQASNIISSSLT